MTGTFLLRRFGQAVLVLALAYTGAFILLSALPGDAVLARYASPDLGLRPEELATIRAAYGYDQPLIIRYVESIWAFMRGDFGHSVASGAKVQELFAEALPQTLTLAVLALVGAIALAVVIAFTATFGAGAWLRRLMHEIPPVFVSLPVFWVGIVLIQLGSFQLGLVPVIGATEAQSLILPVLTLMVPIAAPLAQVLIRSIDEVRAEPFVSVVQARGAGTNWLLWRTVAPNAALPALTMAGLLFGELVGGVIVTETVFARNGIGSLTAEAVAHRDTPVLLAVVALAACVYVTVNFLVDLAVALIDPRQRTGEAGATR